MTALDNFLSWQSQLVQAISNADELINILQLDQTLIPAARLAAQQFALRVPHGFVARMKKGNLNDPLLKQVLPLAAELKQESDYSQDPLAEQAANPLPGLLHKYYGRVLLTLTSACAVNCRFCFRRHFSYANNNPGSAGWEQTLAYIANDITISEVILSGGDPLAMSDSYLNKFTQKLSAIDHVKTLRIHSRLPIVIPERITSGLIEWFAKTRLKSVLVTHCNHPQEIDESVETAARKLQKAGVTLLNQTVLLRGVNDTADALVALSTRLFTAGILPYYLHMPDKVQGTAHFDVTEQHARDLHWQMAQKLPGYLVPRLVREVPGAPAKLLVK